MACLASRFPYGEATTAGKLTRVERAEAFLTTIGFGQVRVRSHGDLARVEVESGRIGDLATKPVRQQIVTALKDAGFVYVAIDLQGYRTGSMNETLPQERRMRHREIWQ